MECKQAGGRVDETETAKNRANKCQRGDETGSKTWTERPWNEHVSVALTRLAVGADIMRVLHVAWRDSPVQAIRSEPTDAVIVANLVIMVQPEMVGGGQQQQGKESLAGCEKHLHEDCGKWYYHNKETR